MALNNVEFDSATEHPAPSSDVLQLDAQRYTPYLADLELDERQRLETLAALWNIMRAFVDLGFGVSAVQAVLPFMRAASPTSEQDSES